MHHRVEIITGDLLDQEVDVIVNPWNRNLFPWWLLLPQGVSGAIKRRAGHAPFRELARMPRIPLGGAVLTGPGRLPHRALIHVAGINLLWRASESSVRTATTTACRLATDHGFRSIAFPLIGAGSGGMNAARSEALMLDQLDQDRPPLNITLVRFRKRPRPPSVTAPAVLSEETLLPGSDLASACSSRPGAGTARRDPERGPTQR